MTQKRLGMVFIGVAVGIVLSILSCKAFYSKTSSISLNFPQDLPEDIKDGGYAFCLERKDFSDEGCSKEFFKTNSWDSSGIDSRLNSDCSGYKIKMWLWANKGGKKVPMYGLNTNFKKDQNTYEDGYVSIPKEKLGSQKLKLELNFLSLNASGGSKSGSKSESEDNSQTTDVDISVQIEEGSGSLDNGSNSLFGGFEASCKAKEESKGDGVGVGTGPGANDSESGSSPNSTKGGSTSSQSVPDGKIHSFVSEADIKVKSGGFPSVRIYSMNGCPACEGLESAIRGSSNGLFKGKVHVYMSKGYNPPNCPGYSQQGFPTSVFYTKEGTKATTGPHPCVVSYPMNDFKSEIDHLSK